MTPGYIMKTTGSPVTELVEYLTNVVGITDYNTLESMKDYKDIYYVYWTPDKTCIHYRHTEHNSDDEYKLHLRILEGRVLVEYNQDVIGFIV